MILIAQLTSQQPELKLLINGAYVNCSILSKRINSFDPSLPPLNIGWRIIDRSQTPASPDCLLLHDSADNAFAYQISPAAAANTNPHNLKEFCLNTGDYKLTGSEQVTLMLEIDTAD
jgi:hypothetical protein